MNYVLFMKSLFSQLALVLLCFVFSINIIAKEPNNKVYKIGVLAYKGFADATATWQPHEIYLNNQLSPLKFKIIPLSYVNDELSQAVKNHQVDFVITNPGHYAELELGGYISRLATRRKLSVIGPLDLFGGTAIALASRGEINIYSDLRNRTVLIPSTSSLGGWKIHLREALDAGLDLRLNSRIIELKNHRKVVEAILAGEGDVGFIRSGLLEELIAENNLVMDDIKIISQNKQTIYPHVLSTRLYPEWPFAVVNSTPKDISVKVVKALYNLSSTNPAAISAGIYSWTIPGDYSSVSELFRETSISNFTLENLTFNSVLKKYLYQILMVLLVITLLLAEMLRVRRKNLKLALKIDAQKLTEFNYQEDNKKWLYIMDCFQEPIALIDLDDKLLHANSAFFKMVNLSNAQAINKTVSSLIHPSVENCCCTVCQARTSQKNSFVILEKEHLANHFDCAIGVKIMIIRDDKYEPIGTLMVLNNLIKERKSEKKIKQQVEELILARTASLNMMEDIEATRQEAEQASKVKSEFLANMSHEIRTPLNAVTGMSYLLKQTDMSDQQIDYIDTIDSSMMHVLSIINDLLDISKVEAGKLKLESIPFNLNYVIDNLMKFISHDADKKNIEVLLKISEDVPDELIGDPTRLGQVLINLAGNAVKFCEQGMVAISIDVEEVKNTNATFKFSVKDTGIGMNEQQINKLFAAFEQADSSTTRKYGGTGLGLSISKYLVEKMGGRISVKSIINEGSEFSFMVEFELQKSIDKDKCSKEKLLSESTVVDSLNQIKVLVVDDQPTNRMIAKAILKKNGFHVEMVNNGKLAVELIAKEPALFDVILMDIQMPVMDGFTATREIRKKLTSEQLPIIAITAHAMDEERQKCFEAGMNSHIAKPIDVDVLLSEIHKIL